MVATLSGNLRATRDRRGGFAISSIVATFAKLYPNAIDRGDGGFGHGNAGKRPALDENARHIRPKCLIYRA